MRTIYVKSMEAYVLLGLVICFASILTAVLYLFWNITLLIQIFIDDITAKVFQEVLLSFIFCRVQYIYQLRGKDFLLEFLGTILVAMHSSFQWTKAHLPIHGEHTW